MKNESVGKMGDSKRSCAFSLFSAGQSYCVLGRSPGFGEHLSASRFTFPGTIAEWCIETDCPIYSGGTAPVFHRTSLLSPKGHLRTFHK